MFYLPHTIDKHTRKNDATTASVCEIGPIHTHTKKLQNMHVCAMLTYTYAHGHTLVRYVIIFAHSERHTSQKKIVLIDVWADATKEKSGASFFEPIYIYIYIYIYIHRL